MPTLDRSERQRLRVIQQHLLQHRLSAGAEYKQMSTVGVVFHPNVPSEGYNVVMPHQGVAWTRSQDITDAFDYLEAHNREPSFQFLETLFPEAFSQQLAYRGLVEVERWPVWLFEPFYGPPLPDERLYGQAEALPLMAGITIVRVESESQRQQWESLTGRSYIPSPARITQWLACHQQKPIGAVRMSLHADAARIDSPSILPDWHGFNIEDALVSASVHEALHYNAQLIYSIDDTDSQASFQRLGFIRFSSLLTFHDRLRIVATQN